MKKQLKQSVEQPAPFTPGLSQGEVRDYALKLYFEKLSHDQYS
jgi:hypothetical protein